MAGEEELEKQLQELRDQLQEIFKNKLVPEQVNKINEWINLAKTAQASKTDWEQTIDPSDKAKAEKKYLNDKNLFEQAIAEAKNNPNPANKNLAQAANFISKRTKNNDILESAKKELLDSAIDQSRQKYYKDMSEGELLGEILFKMFGLTSGGAHVGHYKINQWLEQRALKNLDEANNLKDPKDSKDSKDSNVIFNALDRAKENFQKENLFDKNEDSVIKLANPVYKPAPPVTHQFENEKEKGKIQRLVSSVRKIMKRRKG